MFENTPFTRSLAHHLPKYHRINWLKETCALYIVVFVQSFWMVSLSESLNRVKDQKKKKKKPYDNYVIKDTEAQRFKYTQMIESNWKRKNVNKKWNKQEQKKRKELSTIKKRTKWIAIISRTAILIFNFEVNVF